MGSTDSARRIGAAQAIAARKVYRADLASALRRIVQADHFTVRLAAQQALAAVETERAAEAARLAVQPPPQVVSSPTQRAAPVGSRPHAPVAGPRTVLPWLARREPKGRGAFLWSSLGALVLNLFLLPLIFVWLYGIGPSNGTWAPVLVYLALNGLLAGLLAATHRYAMAVGLVAGAAAAFWGWDALLVWGSHHYFCDIC